MSQNAENHISEFQFSNFSEPSRRGVAEHGMKQRVTFAMQAQFNLAANSDQIMLILDF